MNDFLSMNSAQSAMEYHKKQQKEECYRNLQSAGAQANIEAYKVLKQQLAEQTEINQRLEREFAMGAREAVITRKIAYWSLGVGIAGVVVAIIAIFVGVLV